MNRFLIILAISLFYCWTGTATYRYKYSLIKYENQNQYQNGITPHTDGQNVIGASICGIIWPLCLVAKFCYDTTGWIEIKSTQVEK